MTFMVNPYLLATVAGWYALYDGSNSDTVDTVPGIASGGTITIPGAWNGRRVRFATGAALNGDAYALKGGSSFMGAPRLTVNSISGTNQKFGTAHSAPITVATNETYTLNILGTDTNYSWAQVELLMNNAKCCLAKRSTTLSIGTSLAAVDWNAEEYDDASFHDNSTNPSRMTIPSGTTGLFRVTANLEVDASGGELQMELRINGSRVNYTCPRFDVAGNYLNLISPPIALSAGDYVEIWALTTSASNLQASNNSWFAIEELESGLQYAIGGRSTNGSGMSSSTDTLQPLNTESVDVGGWFTSGDDHFTVPSGVTACRMGGQGTHGASSSGTWNMWMVKSTGAFPGAGRGSSENTGTDNVNFQSAIKVCASSDRFDCYARTNAGAQFLASGASYWIEEAKDYS